MMSPLFNAVLKFCTTNHLFTSVVVKYKKIFDMA